MWPSSTSWSKHCQNDPTCSMAKGWPFRCCTRGQEAALCLPRGASPPPAAQCQAQRQDVAPQPQWYLHEQWVCEGVHVQTHNTRPTDRSTSHCSRCRAMLVTVTEAPEQGGSFPAAPRCHLEAGERQGLPRSWQEPLMGRKAANVFRCQHIHFPPKHVNTQGVIGMELTKELWERSSNGNDRYSGLCYYISQKSIMFQ